MAKELPRQSGEYNINIEDGIGFPSGNPLVVTYKIGGTAVDVTGYTAKFELRDIDGGTGAELLALTEGAGGITVGTTDGTFSIVITPAQANFGNREMRYNLVVYNAGSPVSLLRGKCTSHAMAVD